MNENLHDKSLSNELKDVESGVDRGRRKLGAAGVAGSAVILSLASKSAVAGWGSCTGSELASTNLSRNGTANPCGCSPGSWWNGAASRIRTSSPTPPSLVLYPFTLKFNAFFGVDLLVDKRNTSQAKDRSFQDCGPGAQLTFNPDKLAPQSVAQHAIAALMNAAYYGARYPVTGMQSPDAVKNSFVLAFTNNMLTEWVALVDVYKPGVWCSGENHKS